MLYKAKHNKDVKPVKGMTFGYREERKDPDNGVPGPGKYSTSSSSVLF